MPDDSMQAVKRRHHPRYPCAEPNSNSAAGTGTAVKGWRWPDAVQGAANADDTQTPKLTPGFAVTATVWHCAGSLSTSSGVNYVNSYKQNVRPSLQDRLQADVPANVCPAPAPPD
jgi:hypothetical protein